MNRNLFNKHIDKRLGTEETLALLEDINSTREDKAEFSEMKNSFALASSKLAPDLRKSDFGKLLKEIDRRTEQSDKFTFKKLYRYASVILFPIFFFIHPTKPNYFK